MNNNSSTDRANDFSLEQLSSLAVPILPVIQIQHADDIIPIGETLLEGGVDALEITLRSSAGIAAIEIAKQRFPQALISAGTVTSVELLKQVDDLGVDFVVTPGITTAILEYAAKHVIKLLPGVSNPSDIMLAQSFEFNYLKLFPASVVGGINLLRSLRAPFPQARFCPTGGLNANNFMGYLALDNTFCVGGSWMLVNDGECFSKEKSLQAIKDVRTYLK